MDVIELYGTDGPSGAQPEAIPCAECAKPMPWAWYEFQGRRPPRWLRPPSDHCTDCVYQQHLAKLAREFAARQASAGIPERYRAFDWDVVDRPAQMSDGEFRRWCRKASSIGIVPANEDAAACLAAWTPATGSVYLQGRVGCGKTLMACATASRLLRPSGAMTEIERDGHRYVRLDLPTDVIVMSDEAFDSANRRRRDDLRANREIEPTSPAERYIAAGVLIYDDFGTMEKGNTWLQTEAERVIDGRYGQGRPVIFTSNIRFEALAEKFSPRMVSRIAEMVGPRRYELAPIDWRTD